MLSFLIARNKALFLKPFPIFSTALTAQINSFIQMSLLGLRMLKIMYFMLLLKKWFRTCRIGITQEWVSFLSGKASSDLAAQVYSSGTHSPRIEKFISRQGENHFGFACVLFSTSRSQNDLTQSGKKILNSQSGQVAILVALATLTMMLVFAMVINVGLVVHAKINLQNSADMAAAAGAAQQARILTEVGRKNFELRQNYKEFLYLNWVLHNRDNYWFKKESKEHPPVFCLEEQINAQLESKMNLCGNERFVEDTNEKIKIHYNQFAISPISFVASMVVRGIDQRFQNQFKDIGEINRDHAIEDRDKYLQNSHALWSRYLHQLTGLINSPVSTPSASLEKNWREGLQTSSIPIPPQLHGIHAVAEATARNNLTPLNQRTQIVPLLPNNGEYLRLNKVSRSFNIWWANFKFDPRRSAIVRDNKPLPVNNFILGVKKDPSVLTYYAVKLVSQPNLPFLPTVMAKALKQSDFKLVAYAAAKPFGSQIGPQQDDPLYPKSGHHEVVPNISFYKGDPSGFYNPQIRRTIASLIRSTGIEGGPAPKGLVRHPNQFEVDSYIVGPEDMDWQRQWGNSANLPMFVTNPGQLINNWGPNGSSRLGYSIKLIPLEEVARAGNAPLNIEELRLIRH